MKMQKSVSTQNLCDSSSFPTLLVEGDALSSSLKTQPLQHNSITLLHCYNAYRTYPSTPFFPPTSSLCCTLRVNDGRLYNEMSSSFLIFFLFELIFRTVYIHTNVHTVSLLTINFRKYNLCDCEMQWL